MEIVLAALVAAAVAGIVVVAGQRRGPAAAAAGSPRHVRPDDAGRQPGEPTVAQATAVPPLHGYDPADEAELRERRAEIARIEERVLAKEEALDVRLAEIERK